MYISKEERIKLKESFQNEKVQLNEGSWALPFNTESAIKLKKFMSKPRSKEDALEMLYYIFGDDELFDDIGDPVDPTDIRYEVKNKLKELLQAYENGGLNTSEVLNGDAKDILNSIISSDDILKEAIEEDSIEDDGKVPVQEDDITVEVDGQVVTDPVIEEESAIETSIDNYGPKLAITDMLLQAVNDENTTIQYYNSLIAACNQEGFTDIANVIKHINEEENIHVGMLQYAMTTLSEQSKEIDKGTEEAEEIISGNVDVEHEDIES